MKRKILITGLPRSGKSTLILKLIDYFSKHKIPIYGFLTPEVREGHNRIGFDVDDIKSGERKKLARIGNYKTKYKLGKYCLFLEEFEGIISKLDKVEFREENSIIIDEIGKMELFSKKFQGFVKKVFSLNLTVIATIGLKLNHPLKNYILKLPDVHLLSLTRQNFQIVFEEVISLIS